MEQVQVQEKERMKIPAEAVELYTRYIHGEVSRREFLDGVKRFAIAGLTAEVIVQALMPNDLMSKCRRTGRHGQRPSLISSISSSRDTV